MRRISSFMALLFVAITLSPVAADEEGLKLLDQATEKKLQARTLAQLAEVADLCEKAIKAGLDDEDKEFAVELLTASLYQRAEQLSNVILRGGGLRDPRWRFMRRVADADLERILKYDGKMGQALLLRAQLDTLPEGNRDRARKTIQQAYELVEEPKDKSKALLIRGTLSKDDKKRIADFNQALKLDPNNVNALRARAFEYLRTGKNKEATKDLETLLEKSPDNIIIQMALVETLVQRNQLEAALKILAKIVERNPRQSMGYTARGRILLELGRNDKALADANKALEINPLDADSLLLRSRVYTAKKDYENALLDVDELIRVRPNLPLGYLLRSSILEEQGKIEEAITDAKKLLSLQPKSEQFLLMLGDLLYRNKQPKEAMEIYDGYVEKNKRSWLALYARADLKLNIGEHKTAIDDYRKAMKINDKNESVLNNLAWVLATSPDDSLRDGKESIKLATKACEITEYSKAYILSTLAAGYAEVGDFENALKWSQKAVDVEKNPKQKKLLAAEVESYKKKKPWRERKSIDDDDDDESSDSDSGSEKKKDKKKDQKDADKKDKKAVDSKSEKKKAKKDQAKEKAPKKKDS